MQSDAVDSQTYKIKLRVHQFHLRVKQRSGNTLSSEKKPELKICFNRNEHCQRSK